MINPIRKSTGLIVLLIVMTAAFSSCKSKKKAMEAEAAEKARIEREQADKKLKAEELAKREAEEKAQREAEERLREQNEAKANTPSVKLNQYFNAIANSGNTTSANTSINEAMTLFASPNTPVLIVISEENGMKDYDKPTTIKDYLNYLKDQKKNSNTISDLKTDGSGKITELELKKN